MGRPVKGGIVRENPAEQATRDQEVLRATKELAAYFRGRRTEREARAALKTIKAFVRDRERTDPKDRRPLPGVRSAEAVQARPPKNRTFDAKASRRKKDVPATLEESPKTSTEFQSDE